MGSSWQVFISTWPVKGAVQLYHTVCSPMQAGAVGRIGVVIRLSGLPRCPNSVVPLTVALLPLKVLSVGEVVVGRRERRPRLSVNVPSLAARPPSTPATAIW